MRGSRTEVWQRHPEVEVPASGDLEWCGGHAYELTRDRFDLIAQHCADLDIPVEWEDLGPMRRGKCQVSSGIIVLNPRMTLAQAAATLSHEASHWAFGDRYSTPRIERRAWQYGAALLIEPWEYAAAESLVGCHPAALAIELGVTPRLIEAWREWWLQRGSRQASLATSKAVIEADSRSASTD